MLLGSLIRSPVVVVVVVVVFSVVGSCCSQLTCECDEALLSYKVQESYKVQVSFWGCFKTCFDQINGPVLQYRIQCWSKETPVHCWLSTCSLEHHLHFMVSQGQVQKK